jgi:hypothetical protein
MTTTLALQFLALLGSPQGAAVPAAPPGPNPDMMSVAEGGPPRGLVSNLPGAFDGVTLFSPLNSNDTYLIDMQGEVVHHWRTDSPTASGLELLDDGTLLRAGREDREPKFRGGGIGGRIQRLAPDGSLVWSYQLASQDLWHHHDLELLPNGNVLAIAWERIPAEEAVGLGRDPAQVGAAGLWGDVVLEIRPTPPEGGEIVWTWRVRDHLIQDFAPGAAGYGSIPDHPERVDINADHRDRPPLTAEERQEQEELEQDLAAMGYIGGAEEEPEEGAGDAGADAERRRELDLSGDWLHTNAVAYQAEHDLIVLSTPELCELWVIDHSTTTAEAAGSRGGRRGRGGDLLWRWGNPKNYGRGTEADRRLFYQHDPTWLAYGGGALGLLVFNNGRGRPEGDYSYSSVDELVLPFDPQRGFTLEEGAPYGPEEPDWTYAPGRETFFSAFISGAQRLPNGNTLICSGAPGRIFEVTPAGEVVWDFKNPYGGELDPPEHAGRAPPQALFRATRLPLDHPGVAVLLE